MATELDGVLDVEAEGGAEGVAGKIANGQIKAIVGEAVKAAAADLSKVAAEAAKTATTEALRAFVDGNKKAEEERRAQVKLVTGMADHLPEMKALEARALADSTMTIDVLRAEAKKLVTDAMQPTGGFSIAIGEEAQAKQRDAFSLVLLAKSAPQMVAQLEGEGRTPEDQRARTRMAKAAGFDTPELFVKALREARAEGRGDMGVQDVVMATATRDALAKLGRRRMAYSLDEVVATAFGHGSSDFPAITENVLTKTLLMHLARPEATWDRWCAIGDSKDFKPQTLITMSQAPKLLELPEGGKPKEAKFKDRKESIKVRTLARELSLTREIIINDDLGHLTQMVGMFGESMTLGIEEEAVAWLAAATGTTLQTMQDGQPFFSAVTGNRKFNNIGSAAALSMAALETAYLAFGQLKDFGTEAAKTVVQPRILLVPWALKLRAMKLMQAEFDPDQTVANRVDNVMRGAFEVIASPFMDDLISTTAWYLLADPNRRRALQVNFLNGKRVPFINPISDGSMLGKRWEIVADWGFAYVEPEAARRNAGA